LVRLVREQDASIVTSRTFTATAPAASTETMTVIEAFGVASDQVFAEFATWLQGALAGR
jgi:cholesterol transport system auxiliary component